MATCPKCNNGFFVVEDTSPANGQFIVSLIACSTCGCVVGALEAENVGDLIHRQNQTLNAIANAMGLHVTPQ